MTIFSTPLARQFVGFDTLFDELNEMATRKESNYPAYNIAKDDDEHYRIELALAGFSRDEISIQTEKGILTVAANKAEDTANYLHQGIAKRAFSKRVKFSDKSVLMRSRTSFATLPASGRASLGSFPISRKTPDNLPFLPKKETRRSLSCSSSAASGRLFSASSRS